MTLTIQLEHTKNLSTDDSVRGRVTLDIKSRLDVSRIEVALVGTLETPKNTAGPFSVSYTILNKRQALFPDYSTGSLLTLAPGIYLYYFSLDLPEDLPPTYYHSFGENYARISYRVVASVVGRTPLTTYCGFSYAPRNSVLRFRSDRVLRALGTSKPAWVPFAIANGHRAFWKSKMASIPLSLEFHFKPFMDAFNVRDRVLRASTFLSRHLDLSIVSPYLRELLLKKLGYVGPQGEILANEDGLESMVISNIQITLLKHVTTKGTGKSTLKLLMLDAPVDYVIDAEDFVESANGLYRFTLLPDWIECAIPTVYQSFETEHLVNEYSLEVRIRIGGVGGGRKLVVLKHTCPVVILRHEGRHYETVAPAYDCIRLPDYSPSVLEV